MAKKNKNQNPSKIPYSINLSKNVELCKGILLFTAGYIFCYMFLLDYVTYPNNNIFFRWSTTSFSQFKHPVLFFIWCFLCASSFFLNLEHLRRKYNATPKILGVLQYLGVLFLLITFLVPTHIAPHETLTHYLKYYIHLFSAMFYALSNMGCFIGVVILQMKRNKCFKILFYVMIVYIVVVAAFFAIHLCGFIETVPTLMIMAALYILNFTTIMDPKSDLKQKAQTTKQK